MKMNTKAIIKSFPVSVLHLTQPMALNAVLATSANPKKAKNSVEANTSNTLCALLFNISQKNKSISSPKKSPNAPNLKAFIEPKNSIAIPIFIFPFY
ncbi:hypothetical protein [Vibrio sp. TRT 17S01]|uniref:hypothetical protein n=1 Tax=Vibrio sp. TRT 17S01 TaxID=3418505 RepID=UPI003CF71529